MLGKNPILHCLFLILIHFLKVSYARENQNPHCKPSTCGNIETISYPFRLKSDPQNCGDHNYELECQNNTTLLYLDSHKYYVKSINYQNYTIRLTYASIIQDDLCSFPNHSPYFGYDSPYRTESYDTRNRPDMVTPITFLSCPNPLNGSQFLLTDSCVNRSYGFNTSTSPTKKLVYIKIGYLQTSDLKQTCTTNLVAMTSMRFRNPGRASLAEIHASLLYGFELSWFSVRCPKCRGRAICWLDGNTCHVISCDGNWNAKCEYESTYIPSFNINDTVAELLGYVVLIIGYSIAVRVLFGCPFILWLIIYKCRRRHLSTFNEIEGFLQNHTSAIPIRYSYSDIKKMTCGFREKLGQGGYGCVYKGKQRSGHDVAVKLLTNLKANGQDFINEVGTIGRIHHANVVKLVGYCCEKSSFALVYDFMPNGSLDKYILRQEISSSESLSWKKKHVIALGVARGINYLHQGCCDIQILHFDIKPHNILLDHDFNPKISDFGLAKLYSNDNSKVSLTNARGTIGYVAPELINRSIGGISHKADVYSFGMLLIELVGAMKSNNDNNESSQYFPYWIYDCLEKGKEIEVIGDICDDDDAGDERIKSMKRNMVVVGLWCVRMDPNDRPSMSKVVEMLEEEDNGLLDMPPKPSMLPPQHVNVWVGDGNSSSRSTELYDFPSSYM